MAGRGSEELICTIKRLPSFQDEVPMAYVRSRPYQLLLTAAVAQMK